MAFETGDVVLCTVDRIVGTVVFVKIEGENKEGSIILSEIAPGRIRNLRDYVVPKKKIVCKVLRVSGERIDLSLRRVTPKEKKELLEQIGQEKSYNSILNSIFGDKAGEIIKKIKEGGEVQDFMEDAKKSPKELERIAGKENAEKILKIIKTQKKKKAELKKEIKLTSTQPNGLELIKKILSSIKNAEINYLSAGRYLIKIESDDIKKADNELKEILNEIEKKAKEQKMDFLVKEK